MKTLVENLLSKKYISNNGELNVNINIVNSEAKRVLNIDFNLFASPTDFYEILFS